MSSKPMKDAECVEKIRLVSPAAEVVSEGAITSAPEDGSAQAELADASPSGEPISAEAKVDNASSSDEPIPAEALVDSMSSSQEVADNNSARSETENNSSGSETDGASSTNTHSDDESHFAHSEDTTGSHGACAADINYAALGQMPTKRSSIWDLSFIRTHPSFDRKQYMNTLYFTFAAFGMAEVAQTLDMVALYGLAALFMLFGLAALVKVKASDRPGKSEVHLSKGTRRAIRASALLLPIPFMLVVGDLFVSDYLVNKSDALYQEGKYADQLQYLKNANMIDPFRKEAIAARIAGSYWAASNDTEALDWANKAVAMNPNDGYAWSTKAAAMLNKISYDKDDFHHLTALKPVSSQDYIDTGNAVREALRLYPENGENYRVAAILNANEGYWSDAISTAEKHLTLHNDESGARSLLAEIYLKQADYERALSYANEALTVAKTEGNDYSWALKLRAEVLNALGRSDEAATDLAQAAAIDKAP